MGGAAGRRMHGLARGIAQLSYGCTAPPCAMKVSLTAPFKTVSSDKVQVRRSATHWISEEPANSDFIADLIPH